MLEESTEFCSSCPVTLVSVGTQTTDQHITDGFCFRRNGFTCDRLHPEEDPALNRRASFEDSNNFFQVNEKSRCCNNNNNRKTTTNTTTNDEKDSYVTHYEEITLQRRRRGEKIGLTLWYSNGSDVTARAKKGSRNDDDGDDDDDERGEEKSGSKVSRTCVFVGEIAPQGIAGIDGRLRIGDRIVQINGRDVGSREDVLHLLNDDQSSHHTIRLLLSRQVLPIQSDDGFTDDALVDLDCFSFRDEHGRQRTPLECIDEEDATDDDDDDDTATTNENDSLKQDSGVGKTDDSMRNEESSEQEVTDDFIVSPLSDGSFSNRHQRSNESFASNDGHESDQDGQPEVPSIFQCQQFYELLKERCNADFVTKTLAASSLKSSFKCHLEEDGKVMAEMMDNIHMNSSSPVVSEGCSDGQSETLARNTTCLSRKVPRMGTRIDFARQGKPCSLEPVLTLMCSRPHASDIVHPDDESGMQHWVQKKWGESSIQENLSSNCSERLKAELVRSTGLGERQTTDRNSNDFHPQSNAKISMVNDPKKCVKKKENQICQTDDEGDYESLIPLSYILHDHQGINNFNYPQQTLLKYDQLAGDLGQYCLPSLGCSSVDFEEEGGGTTKAQVHHHTPIHSSAQNIKEKGSAREERIKYHHPSLREDMEWVVKRRSDGSRYIMRRPIRHRLLKERARKVEEERACQTTTDDDAAVSENVVKVGRNWTRDDRRRHIERTRCRRREKEPRQRVEGGAGGGGGGGEDGVDAEPCIVELSRKKMLRRKEKRTLDDFTTLQEIFVHGSRDPGHGRSFNPLLSVTTV